MEKNYEAMREQAEMLCNAGKSLADSCKKDFEEAEADCKRANDGKKEAEEKLNKLERVISGIKRSMEGN